MNEDMELDFIEVEGKQVSLAEIAGVDLESVTEQRGMTFPKGVYLWEIVPEPAIPALQKIGDKGSAGWVFNCKCLSVLLLQDPADAPNNNPMELVGKTHRETFFLNKKDVVQSMGFVKAFLLDLGIPAQKGALSQHCANSVGFKFQAQIQHRKNPNDKDAPPFVGFNKNVGKVISAAKLQAAAA